ncbi:MAG: hypothetical protein R3F59_33450 [Myxococcota bacterium]
MSRWCGWWTVVAALGVAACAGSGDTGTATGCTAEPISLDVGTSAGACACRWPAATPSR